MKKKRIFAFFVIAILLAFIAGFFLGNSRSHRKIKKTEYTVEFAQSLFQKWDTESYFTDSKVKLSDLLSSNDIKVFFFWATWCPYCKEIIPQINNLVQKDITVIGIPFDDDKDYYNYFKQLKHSGWDDLFIMDTAGALNFIPRKDGFDVPSIPSFWIIENNAVKKVIVGSKKINELHEYLGMTDR